jgi:hypothetical protein
MPHIPWEQVLGAIRLRDAAGLRLLAQQAGCNQRRGLLLVFADIVENGPPIVETRAAVPQRIAAQRDRAGWQPSFPNAFVSGQRCTCRTALRRADGYSIELRIEQERGSRRIDIFGQISTSGRSQSKVGGNAVLLVSGKHAVARAVTDATGGFHLRCAPTRSLQLRLLREPDAEGIEVPLSELISRFLLHCGKAGPGAAAAVRAC